MAVELDARAFKALSSPTRVELLKKLRQKPRSLTSLAEESKLSVQATDEHLHKLVAAGLVEKDKKSKWAYYRLTAAGNSLVQPDRQPVYLMLAVSLMLLLAAAITWNQSFGVPEFKTGSSGALKNEPALPTIMSQSASQDIGASSGTETISTSASSPNDQTIVTNAPMTAASKALAISNKSQNQNESAPMGIVANATKDTSSTSSKGQVFVTPKATPSQKSPSQIPRTAASSAPPSVPASGIPWTLVFGIGGLAILVVAGFWWRKA